MKKELLLIQKHLGDIDKVNLKISKANVGWHLDHTLKVINSVSDFLIKSEPKEYKKTFHLLRSITFAVGAFPRGKAKAPKKVLPPKNILKEDIEHQLKLAYENIKLIKELEDHKNFMHPIFKQLNKQQTFKFLKIHTNHHLKIVKSILK
ncbi:hypothetical protein BW723_01310 [Polaribacter reichenbachii]|uniref:DUF1569 domain-containing protein n=1 Tax=Polaribacter reichenbachii TaxID=996801 RepID=A0A1B8TWU9_9FLAO|nr:DUF1569 domain-containing protein [Polaribacter reichenbachii]APZ45010.1 hypothetical protein BW723_01310 [Polaribacter reichenbachii]AUC18873.1 hypothetical protein BTO17_09315 [Polaribacter reichenbachii]OBY63969.1 hypothetical protein LPB301_14380 [Polaribacter reichenbachii]